MTAVIICGCLLAAALVIGLVCVGTANSHVTDFDDLDDEPDEDDDWDWVTRCGEYAEHLTAAFQRIEARQGPGRHRAPEAAPSWVLNTQEIELRWHQIVERERVAA